MSRHDWEGKELDELRQLLDWFGRLVLFGRMVESLKQGLARALQSSPLCWVNLAANLISALSDSVCAR